MSSTPKHPAAMARASKEVASILADPSSSAKKKKAPARDFHSPNCKSAIDHSLAVIYGKRMKDEHGLTLTLSNVAPLFPAMPRGNSASTVFTNHLKSGAAYEKSWKCVHKAIEEGTIDYSGAPGVRSDIISFVRSRSVENAGATNAPSTEGGGAAPSAFASPSTATTGSGYGQQMVSTPSTGARPTFIRPSPAGGTVAPRTPTAAEVALLQQMQAEITANTKMITTNTQSQQVTAESQQVTAEIQQQMLGELKVVKGQVKEHGGAITTLTGQMGDVQDQLGQFNGQLGQFGGRLEAVEAVVRSPQGVAAARGAFGFDGADPASDKPPALTSVASAAGGNADPGTVAVTTAGPGSNKTQPVLATAASLKSSSSDGMSSKKPSATTAVAVAPNTFGAGVAAGTAASASLKSSSDGGAGTLSLKSSSDGGAGPFGAGAAAASDGAKELSTLASLAPAAGGGFGSSLDGGILPFGAGAGSAGAGAGTNGAGFFFNGPTDGSFGAPKSSAPSAAPSVSFGTQESSRKNAVGFQQVSIDVVNNIVEQAKNAQCVGGAENNKFEYWGMADGVLEFVEDKQALLAQSSEMQLFIYQSSEALDKVTHKDLIETIGSHDVPVLIITVCELPPTTFVATNSLQLQQRAFYSLQEKNLWWKEVSPRVHILQAAPIAFGQKLDYEYTLLPIEKPSKNYGKETEKSLDSVEIDFNGLTIVGSKVSDVKDAVKDEKDEAEEEGRAPRVTSGDIPAIVAELRGKKREKEGVNLALLESKTSHVHGMIASHAESRNISLSEAASKMESMEMYKIYPSNLPPPKTWEHFQPTGFRKNTMVNRFSGNCDGYYPKE